MYCIRYIPGYEGLYIITTEGVIFSVGGIRKRKGKIGIVKPTIVNGYYRVTLFDKNGNEKNGTFTN